MRTNKQTNKYTDRQTDRQTDKYMYRKSNLKNLLSVYFPAWYNTQLFYNQPQLDYKHNHTSYMYRHVHACTSWLCNVNPSTFSDMLLLTTKSCGHAQESHRLASRPSQGSCVYHWVASQTHIHTHTLTVKSMAHIRLI